MGSKPWAEICAGVDKVKSVAQVTTLLSKAEQADKEPKVTEEEVQALEAEVSAQGQAVAAAKAVSALFHTLGKLACFAVPYKYACMPER